MSAPELAGSKLRAWREKPARQVYEEFKVEPDKWQHDALDAFSRQDLAKLRLALQACVGPGKSAVLAWCGWNFLSCYGEPGNHPKGAAVSTTWANLQANLWPELAKWQARSEYLLRAFSWTKQRIFANHHPATWFLEARSWNKDADPDTQGRTLSGLHSKYVLALIDESGDIPPAVAKAAEQALSSADCGFGRLVQAGNPSSRSGILYQAAALHAHLWMNIRVTGDPDDPKRSPRIDIEWAREQIRTYGRDNPWVMYAILGLFPPTSINSLLGPDEVRDAMGRHVGEDAYSYSQKRLGVDVARFGDDRTVIFPRQGLVAFEPAILRNAKGHEIAARVAVAKDRWGSEIELIDDTGGWASSAIDYYEQSGRAFIPVNASGKAMDPRYYNRRAECWWDMAQWVKKGGCLPDIGELVAELSEPTYTFKDGRILIEPKEIVKKRIGRSPDLADSLSVTFALPDAPAELYFPFRAAPGLPAVGGVGQLKSEWDPLQER